MTNNEVEIRMQRKIREERRISIEILELISIAEERKIYAERGYPSMFEWLTRRHGYSEGAANRRISAARLLRSVPEAKKKLESGDLNLTSLAKAQSMIRSFERAKSKTLSTKEKSQTLRKIERKSTFEAEQILFAAFPELAVQGKPERISVTSAETSRLSTTLSNDVLERFKKVRDRLAHKLPGATFVEVADFLFQKFLQEQEDDAATAAKQCVKSANKSITPKTRKIVLNRSSNRCTYKDPVTGRICNSSYLLQVDHRVPKALGGNHHEENLRPLCATHNQLMSEKLLGTDLANRWKNQGVGPTGPEPSHFVEA